MEMGMVLNEKLNEINCCRTVIEFKDTERAILDNFLIKKFLRNIVIFAYQSIYHWKGNDIVLIMVRFLLKKISCLG